VSNAQVIAATTALLRRLLLDSIPLRDTEIASLDVTTAPLDKVGADLTRPHLNLFLYQTSINGAWRNRDLPTQIGPNDTAQPRLGLNLYYLITAYGQVDGQKGDFSHRVLGAAVSVLHDHPVLGADEIVDALASGKAERQVERIRIAPLPMTLEEMSKLWTTFQTNYRLSTAYEVAVAIIESDRAKRSALPVLRRGETDQGSHVLSSGTASLSGAFPPGSRPAIRLGERLRLEGQQLDSSGLVVRVRGPHLAAPMVIDPAPGRRFDRLEVALPAPGDGSAMLDWAPGVYTASVLVRRPDLPGWSSNEVPFAVAPIIAVSPMAAPAGPLSLTVTCAPRVRDEQRASLLFGNQELTPAARSNPADPAKPTELVFDVTGAANTSWVVRLRVDGVESVPVDPAAAGPPAFDPQQTVAFT
jgi:hypothetical protein